MNAHLREFLETLAAESPSKKEAWRSAALLRTAIAEDAERERYISFLQGKLKEAQARIRELEALVQEVSA